MQGCGSVQKTDHTALHIVTTMFPLTDWTCSIVKGAEEQPIQIHTLLDRGVDLHNYQPTTKDMMLLSYCDVFIYVGGESDGWVEDVLKGINNPDMVTINLMDVLGSRLKPATVTEEDGHDDHDHNDQYALYDEHIWLSLQNARVLCQAIADVLCEVDPNQADTYRANVADYITQLTILDGAYQAAVNEATCKNVVFADRFPFRYMMDDYGVSYTAAFGGCSTESDAGFDTIRTLADKVDEWGLTCVLILEGQDGILAETVVAATREKNQRILSMNPMQSITEQDLDDGATYLSIMEENLMILKQALGVEIRSEESGADTVLQ